MAKPFRRLKVLMFEQDIDQKYLCGHMKKSQTYITNRMSGKQPFSMDDVYMLCDILKIQPNQIPDYFPRREAQQ